METAHSGLDGAARHGPATERPLGWLAGAVVHSSVLLGIGTVGEVYAASALAGVAPNIALLVGFLATVGTYNLDKVTDREADAVTYAGRAAFVSARPRLFAAVSALAVVAAVGLALSAGGLAGLGLTVFPAAVTAAYSLPVVPGPWFDRLKDVLVVNTAFVALAWAVPVAFVPVAAAATGRPGLAGATVAAAWFFLRAAISVEVHNVRDVDGDRAAGVDTLPTALGVPATQRVLLSLDALSLALLVAAAAAGVVPAWAPVALLPAVALSVWVTSSLTASPRRIERLCTLRDAEGYLMAAGVAVALLV